MYKFFVLVVLASLLFACSPAEAINTTVSDLVLRPEVYEDQTVAVEGKVVDFLGEDSHFIALPYLTIRPCKIGNSWSTCTSIAINLSHVRVGKFLFSDGAEEIVVLEKTGGLYLPIPFSSASEPSLPEGSIVVTGYWTVEKDGDYVLYVSGADETGEPE